MRAIQNRSEKKKTTTENRTEQNIDNVKDYISIGQSGIEQSKQNITKTIDQKRIEHTIEQNTTE